MDRDSTKGRFQRASNLSSAFAAFRQSPDGCEDEATRGQERKRKDSRPPREPEPQVQPPYLPYGQNWAGTPGQQLHPHQGQDPSPPPQLPMNYSPPSLQQQQRPQFQGQGSPPPPPPPLSNYSPPNPASSYSPSWTPQPPPQTNVYHQQPYYHNPQPAPPSNANTLPPPNQYNFQHSNNIYPSSEHNGYPSYDQTQTHSSRQWNDGAGLTNRDMYASPPPQRCRHGGVVGKCVDCTW